MCLCKAQMTSLLKVTGEFEQCQTTFPALKKKRSYIIQSLIEMSQN